MEPSVNEVLPLPLIVMAVPVTGSGGGGRLLPPAPGGPARVTAPLTDWDAPADLRDNSVTFPPTAISPVIEARLPSKVASDPGMEMVPKANCPPEVTMCNTLVVLVPVTLTLT